MSKRKNIASLEEFCLTEMKQVQSRKLHVNVPEAKPKPSPSQAKMAKDVRTIIMDCLKPGTDRGSTQGIIDTKDISVAAQKVAEYIESLQNRK